MSDIYLMNVLTGELLPSSQAIKAYYDTHGIFDDWTSEWLETNIETNTKLDLPNFNEAFN